MRPASLRDRLALTAVLVTAAWVLVLTVAFDATLTVRLRDDADSLVRARAAAVLTTITTGADGAIVLHDPPDDAAIDDGTWVFEGRRVLARPSGRRQGESVARSLVQRGEQWRTTPEPDAARYVALPVRRGDLQVGTVVSVLELDPYSRTRDIVEAASAALGALLLLIVWLVTRASVGRALRPVSVMAGQAERWSAVGVDRRFGQADRPRELAQLAAQLDTVLDRISAVLRRERDLNAELSHELRTPLARLMAEAELGSRPQRSARQARDSLAAVLAHAESMAGIIDTLLATARSQAGAAGRCEAGTALAGFVTNDPRVHLHAGEPVWVGVDAHVLTRLVGPLVDNGLRYARTVLDIALAVRDDRVVITVTDDGPGLDPSVADDPFAPGCGVDDGHGGAGLGLALAKRLAQASGGDVVVAASSGGASFEVLLPVG